MAWPLGTTCHKDGSSQFLPCRRTWKAYSFCRRRLPCRSCCKLTLQRSFDLSVATGDLVPVGQARGNGETDAGASLPAALSTCSHHAPLLADQGSPVETYFHSISCGHTMKQIHADICASKLLFSHLDLIVRPLSKVS